MPCVDLEAGLAGVQEPRGLVGLVGGLVEAEHAERVLHVRLPVAGVDRPPAVLHLKDREVSEY